MRNHFIKSKTIFDSFAGAIFLWALLAYSCQPEKAPIAKDDQNANQTSIPKSTIRHAIGFDLIKYDGYKILHVMRHYNDSADTLSYVFHEKNAIIPIQFAGYSRIEVPVANIALLHSSYLSFFDFCHTKDRIKAISEVKYVYDDAVFEAVQNGYLPEVGYGESLDKEKLLELGITLVVTVGFPNTPNKSQQVLEELGIPVLVFSDWQESTLLGRAEWVKVVAALTNSEDICNEKFDKIEKEYQQLKSLTAKLDKHPKILCNLPFQGAWFVPGGNSYMSNALDDAGARYLWSEEPGTGGIQIDFEVAFAKGIKADFWMNTDFVDRIDEITDRDERLKDFLPIQTGKVYNNNNRVARESANDYWESGIANPHIILADFIKIFHPELLPDHQLFYYKKIE